MTVYGWNVNISSMLLFIFLALSLKNTSLFCSSPLKIRNASIDRIAFFMPHDVRTYASCPCWICITVFPIYFAPFPASGFRESFRCFTPISSIDTYTHSDSEDSISSSLAVNSIFSLRDAFTVSITLSTACIPASVFSGITGSVRLGERQTPSMGRPFSLSNPYIFRILSVVFSSSLDICPPMHPIQSEKVRSFTYLLSSRCWKRLIISAASL